MLDISIKTFNQLSLEELYYLLQGNLIFKGTARNFNPNMCGAATITVAEVEELVPVGSLDPNQIHIPGIFVQRIFQGKDYEKRIEKRTLRQKS